MDATTALNLFLDALSSGDFSLIQNRGFSEGVKILLAAGGLALIFSWHTLKPVNAKRWLAALCLIGALNYAQYSPRVVLEKVDSYDLIHYYLGAKYFEELGYYDLYACALLVDGEKGRYNKKIRHYRAQDEVHGYRERVPIREAIGRGKEIREKKFTPERWKQFEEDFLTLQRTHPIGRKLWYTMINDRGFNGTPMWITVAQPFAAVFPASAIKLLSYVDFFLLFLALMAVMWAYGGTTALWVLYFLTITYSLRWPYVTWAFLRYDWVAALLIAMAVLKKQKWAAGGALCAYAALVRLFPAVWMFGPFAQGVAGLIEKKGPLKSRVDRRLVLMAAGFVAFAVIGEGIATINVGPEAVAVHAGNIREHVKPEELSSRRVGFALALVYNGGLKPTHISQQAKKDIKSQGPMRNVMALVYLCFLGYAMRRRRVDEAFAIGFIPFFLLTTASYYYYVCRVTLIVWHASDLGRLRNRVFLGWLVGLELVTNYIQVAIPGHRVMLVGHLAWGLSIYAFGLVGVLIHEERSGLEQEEDAELEKRRLALEAEETDKHRQEPDIKSVDGNTP